MSIARDDLFHAHIGGMDTLARSCSSLTRCLRTACWRVAAVSGTGWETGLGADILHGNGPGASLGSLHHFVGDTELDPAPVAVARRNSRISSTASSARPLMPIVAGVDSSTSRAGESAISTRVRSSPSAVALIRRRVPLAASRTRTLGGPPSSAFGEVGSVAGQVAAIGVGGQQHGMVDADNRPLRPAKLWNDTQSAAEAARLTEAVGAETWAARVGSVPVASFTINKLAWLVQHEPDLVGRIAKVLLPHDYVNLRLTGVPPPIEVMHREAAGSMHNGRVRRRTARASRRPR